MEILDAAAELLLRFGYRRVTVDDVADRAGIGKGTLYLHWKTKDELLLAVLRREAVSSLDGLVAALRADARVVALHRLTEVQFRGVMGRPLLRALYTGDPAVLGKLGAALHNAQGDRHHNLFDDYLRLLGAHGLLRPDLPVAEISYGYHAVLHGYLTEDSYDRGARPLPLDRTAYLLASTVRRAFEPAAEPPAEILPALAPRAADLFAAAAEDSRAGLFPLEN